MKHLSLELEKLEQRIAPGIVHPAGHGTRSKSRSKTNHSKSKSRSRSKSK